jgi:hypothetical protein
MLNGEGDKQREEKQTKRRKTISKVDRNKQSGSERRRTKEERAREREREGEIIRDCKSEDKKREDEKTKDEAEDEHSEESETTTIVWHEQVRRAEEDDKKGS